MDTETAFVLGEMNRNKEPRVFDWKKAANLIHERKPIEAKAGLKEDWQWTSGKIYENGKPVKDCTYLASTWATPVIVLYYRDCNGKLQSEAVECWLMQSETRWKAETRWPQSALNILNMEG